MSSETYGSRCFRAPVRLRAGLIVLAASWALEAVGIWETSDIGAVWSDNFNRSSLGSNWIILGGANASIVSNELRFVQTDQKLTRQVYYQPWLTSADYWTIRWSQRFGTLNAASVGVGVGIKNFQAAGGNDRGYNALLYGAGANLGRLALQRWDGTTQNLVTLGSAMTLAAGDTVDCSLARSGWTITASATNRANGQVSTTSLVFSDSVNPRLNDPTISRMCFYPLEGTIYVSNLSFAINHRKPARFIVIGASIAAGWDASSYARGFVQVLQSNFTEVVCNESSSWNGTGDAVSLLPEILAHQPETAILTVGANDLTYGYPASQWQGNYANLVAQLQAHGVKVKHCLPTPETTTDQRPLRTWLLANYPASDVIDHWTPLVVNGYQLNPAYDNYDHDGVHPNDAGHLVMGLTIVSNLPPGIRAQPRSLAVAPGSNATFTVTATGPAPLHYQWQLRGTNLASGGHISGVTANTLTVSSVQEADGGGYAVVVSDAAGAVTSEVAILTILSVRPESPSIVQDPVSRTTNVGASVIFTVLANGTAPLSCQWLQNLTPLADGDNISGATSPTLTLTNLNKTNAGAYVVIITNEVGSATSAVATLTVVVPPQFTSVTWLPDKTPLLSFNAVSNLAYRIDASTDLVHWETLTNIPAPTAAVRFNDVDATNFGKRFYRAIWIP